MQLPAGLLVLSLVAGLLWIGGVVLWLRADALPAWIPAWLVQRPVLIAMIAGGLLLDAISIFALLQRKGK